MDVVESEVGVGSQFHVELPLQIGNVVITNDEQAMIDLPPLRILAVDDVPQNLELLQVMLGRLGHSLSTARNGAEAVKKFTDDKFDIILMDVQMPVMNGLEASQMIRILEKQKALAPTPIIAFSASVLEADVKAAKLAGMDGFAHKPIDLLRLTQEIARLLNIDVKIDAKDHNHNRAPYQLNGSVIDWSRGHNLWGSEQRHREAIRQFLSSFRDAVPRMRKLLDKHGELAEQIHKLKGAAGNLALARISNLSNTIELVLSASDHTELPSLLNKLADELINVAETLGENDTPDTQNNLTSASIDSARLLKLLQDLDSALAHGELAETVLAELAKLLPTADFKALDQIVNSFDFDAARQMVNDLQHHYHQEGTAE